jgi:predicted CXXCH cytochrome family protein
MLQRGVSAWLIAVALALAFATAHAASAAEGGVPYPSIPEGQGKACVADTDFMRRNHMDLLKHQRDETMQDGVRGNPYSLRECLDCHVVKGADARPVTASDPQHFCRSCHDYAAVSIDCFGCHASRPEAAASGNLGGVR